MTEQDKLKTWAEGFISGAVTYLSHNLTRELPGAFTPEQLAQFRAHTKREAEGMVRSALADPAVRAEILASKDSAVWMKVERKP